MLSEDEKIELSLSGSCFVEDNINNRFRIDEIDKNNIDEIKWFINGIIWELLVEIYSSYEEEKIYNLYSKMEFK
jgi:hypothetical protein